MRKFLLAAFLALANLAAAPYTPVQSIPSVAKLKEKGWAPSITTISLAGYYSDADKGGGEFKFVSSCTEDGGIYIKDGAGNCFQRIVPTGNLAEFGLVKGSAYDVQANPTSPTSFSAALTLAIADYQALGINELHTGGVAPYLGTSVALKAGLTINCDAIPGLNFTNAEYRNRPGTIVEAYQAPFTIASGQRNTRIKGCLGLPEWAINPAKVSAFGGKTYINPNDGGAAYIDYESMRYDMIKAADTFVACSGQGCNFEQLTIFGFDTPLTVTSASRLSLKDIFVDGDYGLYAHTGGGQTDIQRFKKDAYLSKLGPFPNEEYFSITNIAPSPSNNNAAGHPVCRLTLAAPTNGAGNIFNATDIKTSVLDDKGSPIWFPAWTTNINSGGGLSCMSSVISQGSWGYVVIAQDANTATVDLLGSDYAHSDGSANCSTESPTNGYCVHTTANWDANSNIIRVRGSMLNLNVGQTITSAGTGFPSGTVTIVGIEPRAKGPDPADGYSGELIISATTTAAQSSDTSVALDNGTFASDADPCDGAKKGYCFFLNAAERAFGGNSLAGNASAALPASNGRRYAVGMFFDNVAGPHTDNTFSFATHYGYVLSSSNSCSLSQEGGDNNGELDDGSELFLYIVGSSKGCQVSGFKNGQSGSSFVLDTFDYTRSGSLITTAATITTSTGSVLVGSTAGWPASGTVEICAVTLAGGDCDETSAYEFATYLVVDGTHLNLFLRGQFVTAPQSFSSAHLYETDMTSRVGSTSLAQLASPATTGFLNHFEALHGTLLMSELSTSNTGIAFVSHNILGVSCAASSFPNVTIYYEDATAQAVSDLGHCNTANAQSLQPPLLIQQPSGTSQSATGINGLGSTGLGNINIGSTAGWPPTGILKADNEYMAYIPNSTTPTTSLTVVQRGLCGSAPATHANPTPVIYMDILSCPGPGGTSFWTMKGDGTMDLKFIPSGGTAQTQLSDFGDRALSLSDFNTAATPAIPDCTTSATAALTLAESTALSLGVHIIRLDGTAVGSCYAIGTHTVPAGIAIWCTGPPSRQPTNNDFRNFPNAISETTTAGISWTGSNALIGCAEIKSALTTAAPPTTYQDNYARGATYTGTANTLLGDGIFFDHNMIVGFANCFKLKGGRTITIESPQVDCNTSHSLLTQGGGGLITVNNIVSAPFGTRAGTGGPANFIALPITSMADNGSGIIRVTLTNPCTGANCPLAGDKLWAINTAPYQSAQGGWLPTVIDSTHVDLIGANSGFIAGMALAGVTVTSGSNEITGVPATNINQIQPTQAITGACIPANTQILAVERHGTALAIYMGDASRNIVKANAGCPATETVTVTDQATGITSVTSVTADPSFLGTGYAVGDTVQPTTGTPVSGFDAVITITQVDATTGAVQGVSLAGAGDGGKYTVCPSSPSTTTATSGSGTGLELDIGCSAALILYSNCRGGTTPTPDFITRGVNDVRVTSGNILHCQGLEVDKGSNGVTFEKVGVHDENFLQDQTHYGLALNGTLEANGAVAQTTFCNGGLFFFGAAVLDAAQAQANVSTNVVCNSVLGGGKGSSGFQNTALDSFSPDGNPKKVGITLSGNFSTILGTLLISDASRSVELTGNDFPFSYLFGQSEGTAAIVSGGGNNLLAGSMPIFATYPSGSGPRIQPSTTADLYLTNANCPSVITAGSAGGTLPIHLPPSPVVSCRFTLRPTTNSITIDPNGKTIRLVNAASVTSVVTVAGANGSPQVQIAWNGSTWEMDGGAPDTLSVNGLQNGDTLAHGQVYMSCTTCSAGTGVIQLYPANGPGGLVINGIKQRVPTTGLFLPNSAFSGFTSAKAYIYAVENSAAVAISGITNSGGKAGITLASTIGFQSGDTLYCSNLDGTPLANNSLGDANTTLSGSVVTLTDINFVATNTVAGSCWWLGLVAVSNVHATSNGVEVRSGTPAQTLVGMAYIDASHNLNDTAAARDVISYFNRQPKKMIATLGAATSTTTSATFVTPTTTTIEGQFAAFGPQATPGTLPTPAVQWSANATLTAGSSQIAQLGVCFGTSALGANAACGSTVEAETATRSVVTTAAQWFIMGQTTTLTEGINFADILVNITSAATLTLGQNEVFLEGYLLQ